MTERALKKLLNRPYDALIDSETLKEIGATSDCGMTKDVLIFRAEGFVLKFSKLEDEDYCKLEYKNYLRAKTAGVEKILLPTTLFYKNSFGITFYKQPIFYKCQDDLTGYEKKILSRKSKYTQKLTQKRESKLFNVLDDFFDTAIDDSWMVRAVQYYGYDFMEKVAKWTCENSINDLHEGNIGYIGNFRPVIFDYSGF